jgi:tRNA 2-thiocytidine biosynthesis protein TtcA
LSRNWQGEICVKDFEELYPLSKKICSLVGEAIRDYSMIRPGDKLMIGLSGGKDSLLLSLALAVLRKRSPFKFGLEACLVDQSAGSMRTESVAAYMEQLGIPLKRMEHDTYQIIAGREERSPCSLCANLRRGILASAAKERGCNVLALGHHKDDAAETVLLNLFYEGRFKCWHPHMYMTRSGIRVVRPLIYLEERKIILEARRLSLPVTSSCCPYGDKSKRKAVKEILAQLEDEVPGLKSNVIHALRNFRDTEVWNEGMLNE